MTIHLTEDDLVLHYYGELHGARRGARGRAPVRVRGVPRRLHAAAARAGGRSTRARSRPELPENFERTVWARLEPNLQRARRRLVVMVVLVAGPAGAGGDGRRARRRGVHGRAVCSAHGDASDGDCGAAAEQIRERILLVDLGEHLDRSQMVLVELVSADDREHGRHLRTSARAPSSCVAANRLYRQTAVSTGDAGDRRSARRARARAGGRRGQPRDGLAGGARRGAAPIEARSLLFKVRVVSSDVRQRQKAIVQSASGPPLVARRPQRTFT